MDYLERMGLWISAMVVTLVAWPRVSAAMAWMLFIAWLIWFTNYAYREFLKR